MVRLSPFAIRKKEFNDAYYTILEDTKRRFIPDEIRIINNTWKFIEQWHPDYYHCDEVAFSDDIQCCLDGEADEEKIERVKEMFGDTPEQWECAQLEIDAQLLESSVENFYKQIYKKPGEIRG